MDEGVRVRDGVWEGEGECGLVADSGSAPSDHAQYDMIIILFTQHNII